MSLKNSLFVWMILLWSAEAFSPQLSPRHNTALFAGNQKSFASISSDGAMSGSLGKPKKKKKKKKPLSKKERQRTANGTVLSEGGGTGKDPADQGVQVVRGNRGNKTVTIVRGMNGTSVADKKKLLKSLKSQLGVGGTLVEGVLELQGGTHVDKVVELLKGLGYTQTRKVGK